jgi:hypothetical protein
MQKWRLFANFVLYFLPFLAGALYLGRVFLKAQKTFNRVYFADLVGSGLCGLSVLLAMYYFRPTTHHGAAAPVAGGRRAVVRGAQATGAASAPSSSSPILSGAVHYMAPARSASPSSRCRTTRASPTPASSPTTSALRARLAVRLHRGLFELLPALSRRASRTTPAFNLQTMPANAYLGLYIDSEGRRAHQGPAGRARRPTSSTCRCTTRTPEAEADTVRRAVRRRPVDGGGAEVGLEHVTVAEGNPAVLTAFREDKGLRDFTGDILNNPKVTVIDYDGRLYVAHTKNRYDVIDLSLADSAGLSSPGGFSIVEKYPIPARR